MGFEGVIVFVSGEALETDDVGDDVGDDVADDVADDAADDAADESAERGLLHCGSLLTSSYFIRGLWL